MHFSDLDHYDYQLPDRLIRREPLEPRDSARLFVYDTRTDTVTLDVFKNIAQYLPEKSLLVVNDTKVRPARLWLRKPTGGKIEVFVLVNEWDGEGLIPALVDRKVMIGDRLSFPNGDILIAEKQAEQKFFFRLESTQSLLALLETYGLTPIPHYLESEKAPDESKLRARYQTVFATAGASVAAPTASLHFTEAVFERLASKQIEPVPITLNVGQGTFAPLSEKSFETGRLHREFISVNEHSAERINQAKNEGQSVIAVGTTVMRTLETVGGDGKMRAFSGPIDTFLYPPHAFQVADKLITNFHLPRTSLLLLVEAFLQHKKAKKSVMELYQIAIQEEFSFYSFGDSMLIL